MQQTALFAICEGAVLLIEVIKTMARNPKQNANLKPIKKGELTSDEAKRRGSNGGKKSGEARRNKRDAKSAARYILGLASKGQLTDNLKTLGTEEEDLTNMMALQARLFTMAMSGNIDAYKELMKTAGYDAAERRRDMEIEAKINALGGNLENAKVAVNMANEDASTDVVIYLPEIEDEKDCEIREDENSDLNKENEIYVENE